MASRVRTPRRLASGRRLSHATKLRSLVRQWMVWSAVLLVGELTASADPDVAILPEKIVLRGPEAFHGLLVQSVDGGQYVGPAGDEIELSLDDPSIAVVRDGVLHPVQNGQTTVTARLGSAQATATVEVRGMETSHAWSFRNHVLPVFAKAGCNSGACHGALAGKGGFKLSLRGYDPQSDHFTITRQAKGRRIELQDPARSLLLAKPTTVIPHKGGLRLEPGTLDYRIVAEWIAKGAVPPSSEDAHLVDVQALPATSLLQPGVTQHLIIQAIYSDGRIEDVTRWTKFSSADESVATVDQQGRVSVIGHGEGAVTAWFSSKIAIARVTSPFENQLTDEDYRQFQPRNFIDERILEKLQRLRLPPSPPASDQQFIRRAFLDTIGTLPTAEETRRFLRSESDNKRDILIDGLLNRSEFVDYWTYKWSDILLINGRKLRPKAVKAYYDWTRKHVQRNTRWDALVRQIITAQGNSFEQGATNFYGVHQDPEGLTENVCQAFLGLSIGCAKCHNHPLEKWTNDQYYAMANLFARVRAKGWGGDGRSGDGLRTIYVASKGDLIQPSKGRPQPPAPLDGEPLAIDDPGDRRIDLAEWLTSPENPYFARSVTNRIWSNFFGVGLVEPVDDMRQSNPASNEPLLDAAASYLVQNDFDLKSLMRIILQSHAYQLSSRPLPGNRNETRYYSRYYPRRLMAEVLLDAISQATDVPTEFSDIGFVGADKQKTDFYPVGTRAIQLYDSAVISYFLQTFGRNQRAITCECERSDQPSMVQVLHLSNGDTINEKLKSPNNRIDKLLSSGSPKYRLIESAYLTALARYPTDAELGGILAEMSGDQPESETRMLIEDVFWGILSSREFLFNH